MTDRRVSEDTAILGAAVASGDLFDLVDVSDTTDAATGTNKKILASELAAAITALGSLATQAYASGLVDDLSGVTDAATARTNLGLGSLATKSTVASADITDGTIVNADINAAAAIALTKLATDPLARANHTGTQTMSTISDAGSLATKSAIASADITDGTIVDADISGTAAIAESKIANLTSDLAAKAPLASPALTGNPTAPTQSAGNNSTRLATTAYVDTADALKAPLASPTFTGTPVVPTAAQGTNTTQAASTAYVQGEIGHTVQGYDANTLKSNSAAHLSAGYDMSSAYAAGTQSSGTFTPSFANGQVQTATNNGAHTLAVPSNYGTMVVEYTNGASAGTITTSGFSVVNGASYVTTNAKVFQFFITVTPGMSTLTIVAHP